MTHFIAYHNADLNGDIQRGERSRFISSNKSRLEAAIGQTVWIIQGKTPEKRGAKKVFTLIGKFRPDSEVDELADQNGKYIIHGAREFSFDPPLVLNGLEWFGLLFAEQRNFSFGFNRISDPKIVAELEDSVASYTRFEIETKAREEKGIGSLSRMRAKSKVQAL